MKLDRYRVIQSRLQTGQYALNKLASGGIIFTLLTILSLRTPWDTTIWAIDQSDDSSIPIQYWVYGYAMIAAIAADGILALLPALSNMKQASLYAAAGFISYYSIYAASDQRWLEAVAGACMVLLFYAGKRTFSNESLMTLFCAVVLPLLCWSLL